MRTLVFIGALLAGLLSVPASAVPARASHAALAPSNMPKERTLRTPDGARYRVRWVAPRRAVEGVNTLELHVLRETPGGAVPDGRVALSIDPYMDMGGGDGHGTPFEPPRMVRPGVWQTQIFFTMSGEWQLTVHLDRPGHRRASVLFESFIVHDR